jgi:threonine aldolase
MNFASDNVAGASAQVLEAIVAANAGAAKSYGADDFTARAEQRLGQIFETDLAMFTVATGTAANALALAAMTPPWGAVLSHEMAHVANDECGAPEFFSGGVKMLALGGAGAKPLAADLEAFFAEKEFRPVHQVRPAALSLSQATECGLVYRPDEIAALAAAAKARGLHVHMDGARFANALVAQNASPAALTWRAGVDVMSFGATKNGCLAGEAVIFFDKALAQDFAYRRKRAGQLLSKGRLFGAQLEAYLRDDHWLGLARHANAMARRLSEGLAATGARLAWPVEANEVFPILPQAACGRLAAAGATFFQRGATGADEVLVRMVTSFATTPEEVDRAVAVAANKPMP